MYLYTVAIVGVWRHSPMNHFAINLYILPNEELINSYNRNKIMGIAFKLFSIQLNYS